MITTRRSSEVSNRFFDNNVSNSNVAVLERTENVVSAPVKDEVDAEIRSKMQENLDRLLNYDRYSEQNVEEIAVQDVQVVNEASLTEDDYRPTSTTMQFGEGESEQIYNEMRQQESEESTSYQLNGKGKLVIVLYALLVTVMLALITINAGIIPTLSNKVEAKAAEYSGRVEILSELQTENDYLMSSEHVSSWAEQNGGIKM